MQAIAVRTLHTMSFRRLRIYSSEERRKSSELTRGVGLQDSQICHTANGRKEIWLASGSRLLNKERPLSVWTLK